MAWSIPTQWQIKVIIDTTVNVWMLEEGLPGVNSTSLV